MYELETRRQTQQLSSGTQRYNVFDPSYFLVNRWLGGSFYVGLSLLCSIAQLYLASISISYPATIIAYPYKLHECLLLGMAFCCPFVLLHLVFYPAVACVLAAAAEKIEGRWEQLILTPLTLGQIILGKMLARFLPAAKLALWVSMVSGVLGIGLTSVEIMNSNSISVYEGKSDLLGMRSILLTLGGMQLVLLLSTWTLQSLCCLLGVVLGLRCDGSIRQKAEATAVTICYLFGSCGLLFELGKALFYRFGDPLEGLTWLVVMIPIGLVVWSFWTLCCLLVLMQPAGGGPRW